MLAEQLDEIADQHACMVATAIRTGEPAKAHAAVDRAFEAIAEGQRDRVTLDCHISRIAGVRMTTVLTSANYHTVGDLVTSTPQQLNRAAGIRWKSVDILQRSLARHGFKMSQQQASQA